MATTGQLIRAAREAAGLSQAQLAKRLQGVTNFLVSHWEAGRRPVTDMKALAEALGTTEEALTGEDEAKPKARVILVKQADPAALAPVQVDAPEGFLSITQAQKVLQQMLGRRVYPYHVHAWVQGRGLPAYENSLKKNPQGEPTLLFKRSELEAWLGTQIAPVRAVNQ